MKRKTRLTLAYVLILVLSLGFMIIPAGAASVTIDNNGFQFKDTANSFIQAHGGGIIQSGGYYYWFGENRDGTNYVSVYRSTDLKNWQFRAHVLSKTSDPELATANIERPKVIYNAATGKYVMWMHKENGSDYSEARVAVASSTNIEGPYTYHGSFRPLGYDSRDMTVYNDNGTAYLISATRVNADLNIYKLTTDFLGVDSLIQTLWVGQYREAPAMFKRGSTYFLITSGATGWSPNQAKYATATSITGTWSSLANFGNSNTYNSQSTFVLPIEGSSGTS
jgi:beta-xylosidase